MGLSFGSVPREEDCPELKSKLVIELGNAFDFPDPDSLVPQKSFVSMRLRGVAPSPGFNI